MKPNLGFTVLELMIAIAILAILMGVAAPSLRELRMNAAITGQANDLMATLATARAEAITRGVRIGVCTSSNGTSCTNSQWQQGWIIFRDADADGAVDGGTVPLNAQGALDGGNTLTSAGHATNGAGARYIAYGPPGALVSTLANVTFDLCDSRTTANVGAGGSDNRGRRIAISSTGRAVVQRRTCP
jgi:type IV fimbrial biogenesis protein FimT